MAKRKRKSQIGPNRPEILIPGRKPQMVPMFKDINILQVLELDPDKKYVISFGVDFERAVIGNINIDPGQFEKMNSPRSQAIIDKVVRNRFDQAVKEMIKQLNEFAENPKSPFYLIHLGGDDFIKIVSANKEDQESIFEKEKEEEDEK